MGESLTTTATSSLSQAIPSTSQLTPIQALIQATPEHLQQVLRQLELTGTLAQPPSSNRLVFNTLLGSITLSLPNLPTDKLDQLLQIYNQIYLSQKPLVVLLSPGSPPTQAMILTPQPSQPPSSPPSPQAYSQTEIGRTLPAQSPGIGQIVRAVILPNPLQEIPVSPLLNLPLSYSINSTPMPQSHSPPGHDNPPSPQTSSALAPNRLMSSAVDSGPSLRSSLFLSPTVIPLTNPQTPSLGSTTNTASINLNTLKETGQVVSLKILSIGQGASSDPIAPPVTNVSNQSLLTLTVTGRGPNQETILSFQNISLYVKENLGLAIGTSLTASFDSVKEDPVMPIPKQSDPLTNALSALLLPLTAPSENPALTPVLALLPQPNASLPTTFLIFMTLFQQPSLRTWLSTLGFHDTLSPPSLELLQNLHAIIKQNPETASDPQVGVWNKYPIPLMIDQSIQIVPLYIHNQSQMNERSNLQKNERPPQFQRFLIDLSLSRLGALQVDGLVQPRHLDVIVRSETPLPLHLHTELTKSYAATMGALGHAGSLTFQTGRKHWIQMAINRSQSMLL